jgi:hypothetical protein
VTVVGPLCAPEDWTASLVRAGVARISTGTDVLVDGFPPLLLGGAGKKFAWNSSQAVSSKLSKGSCGSVINLDLIA